MPRFVWISLAGRLGDLAWDATHIANVAPVNHIFFLIKELI